MMSSRLRLTLFLLTMVPAFLILVVILLTTTYARLDDQLDQHVRSARQMAAQLAASADYALISNQPGLLEGSLRSLEQQPGVVAIRITDASGLPWLVRGRQVVSEHQQRFSAVIEHPGLPDNPDDWLTGSSSRHGSVIGQVEIIIDAHRLWQRELALLLQVSMIGLSALILMGIVAWLVATRLASRVAVLQADEARQRRISRELLQDRERRWRDEQDRRTAWGRWSHDIRTPLHGVAGMLELMSTTRLSEEQQGYLHQAREAAAAMEAALGQSPLPAQEAVIDSPLVQEEAAVHWQGRHVLLVEDDLVSQHLLRGILEPWGVHLVCADTGAQALALRHQPWDLVLVDGELPDMNAATLARAWAAAERAGSGTQAPLVAITAHSDPASLARYRAAGLDPVLNKPLRKSHLLSVLTPLLASERPKRR